jgi:hypothetical protein
MEVRHDSSLSFPLPATVIEVLALPLGSPRNTLMVGWPTIYACGGIGRSWRIIQLMPNRSRTWPKREAKNVSSIGIRT